MTRPMNRQWLLARRPEASSRRRTSASARRPPQNLPTARRWSATSTCRSIPTQRGWMAGDTYLPAVQIGEAMRSGAVGQVVESRHPALRPASSCRAIRLAGLRHRPPGSLLPTPVPAGSARRDGDERPRLTGHHGLLRHARPRPPKAGETVVVSGAAGATGSAAGQIAKIAGLPGHRHRRRAGEVPLPRRAARARRRPRLPSGEPREAAPRALPDGHRRLLRQRGRPGARRGPRPLALQGRIVLCGGIAPTTRPSRRRARQLHALVIEARPGGGLHRARLRPRPRGGGGARRWIADGRIKDRGTSRRGSRTPRRRCGACSRANLGKQILQPPPRRHPRDTGERQIPAAPDSFKGSLRRWRRRGRWSAASGPPCPTHAS